MPQLDTRLSKSINWIGQLDTSLDTLMRGTSIGYPYWIVPWLDTVMRYPPQPRFDLRASPFSPPKYPMGVSNEKMWHISNWGTSWRYPMVDTEVSNEKLCRIFLHYLGPLRGPMDISHQGIWCMYPMKVSHCKTSLSHWCIQSMYRITTRLNTQPNRTFMGYFDAIPHAIHQCDTSMR